MTHMTRFVVGVFAKKEDFLRCSKAVLHFKTTYLDAVMASYDSEKAFYDASMACHIAT